MPLHVTRRLSGAAHTVGVAAQTAISPLGARLRDRRVGPGGSLAGRPELAAPATITVTSPSFSDGGELPARHCGAGIGRSIPPALAWDGVPERTRRLLVVVEDVDFPSSRRSGIHAAAVLEPDGPSGSIAEGELVRGNPRFAFVRDHRGRSGYAGPRPLPGHGPHRYVFHVFALDIPITPPADATLASVARLAAGHVIAQGRVTAVREA